MSENVRGPITDHVLTLTFVDRAYKINNTWSFHCGWQFTQTQKVMILKKYKSIIPWYI